MADDGPHKEIIELCGILRDAGKKIILASGRPERTRVATEEWLQRNGVAYDDLFMRPDNDHRADTILKSQMLDAILADGDDISFVIDDRPTVVAMWRERGLVCLQCRNWNERKAKPKGNLTLMVGPSGAGKSTWLSSADAAGYGIHLSHVISSDQIRADLCGDFRDQSKNDEVFAALHAVAKTRLAHGLPCVVDATNIRRQDRLACVALAGEGKVRYVVIDRPIDAKLRDGGWRLDVKVGDQSLIEKHDKTFRSQLLDILKGDNHPNVETVYDLRAVA